MSTKKNILIAGAAVAAMLAVASPAQAAITATTPIAYVSGTSAPAATVAFAAPASVVVDGSGAGYTSAFVAGNTITYTLSQGTFAVLPTVALSGTAGTISYVSGGAGQNFITYQLGGTIGAATVVTLTNVSVNSVTSAANSATVNLALSDGAGGLSTVAATAKTYNLATFTDPYSVSFAAAVAAPQVDLGATAPGSRYTNTNTADLGTITITPNATALRNWSNTNNVGASATANALAVTIPAGPFTQATFSGTCLGASTPITTATSNVVTLTASAISAINATGGAPCTVNVALNGPTTGTSLLGAGSASAALTVALSNVSGTGQTGTTRSFSQTLTAVSYAGGSVFNAGYTVGADANYDFFVNVSNGSTAGPVIVSAAVGGSTGTAVLSSSLAANTSAIYSISTIKDALVAAGMPTSTFVDATSRGQLQVVVPTNARVTPLLQNKTNGQVVEISRQ